MLPADATAMLADIQQMLDTGSTVQLCSHFRRSQQSNSGHSSLVLAFHAQWELKSDDYGPGRLPAQVVESLRAEQLHAVGKGDG